VALRDIIADLIEEFEPEGSSIKTHHAIQAGRPRVMADPEALICLVDEGLGRHLTLTSTRTLGSGRRGKFGSRNDPRQTNMFEAFGLRPRYALDTEEREVKRTDWLTRAEIRKLIALRESQLIADSKHLDKLKDAEETLGPIWDIHPELNFGQASELYFRSRDAA
jgi:hypothetical protein